MRRLDDPDEYKRVMTYPLTFDVHARTDNYEEYVMSIVAKDHEQAEAAANQLCSILGLIFVACLEAEY